MRRSLFRPVLLSSVLLISGSSLRLVAQDPIPISEEFQVNTYTPRTQWIPRVAIGTHGTALVVWASDGSNDSDSHGWSIRGRLLDRDAIPIGPDFQVNSYTTGFQSTPDVAAGSDGGFVVAWMSNGSYGTDTDRCSVQGKLFDAEARAIGSQFQVNSYTTGCQEQPAIALREAGDFVVVWNMSDPVEYGGPGRVRARFLSSDGHVVGEEFQVSSYPSGSKNMPRVATGPQSRFVVSWASKGSFGSDTGDWSIQARRFKADGRPIEPEFQVNSYSPGDQLAAGVAMDGRGGFTVAWESPINLPLRREILGQRFGSGGERVGEEFVVSEHPASGDLFVPIASMPNGEIFAVWSSYYYPSISAADVDFRQLLPDGTPLAGQYQVNTYSPFSQHLPDLAVRKDGAFLVVWTATRSQGTDTYGDSIWGRLLRSSWIHIDGFESGDTSAWSGVHP